jgi:THO complex subunit 3
LKLIKQIKYNKVDINGFQWSKGSSTLDSSSTSISDKLIFVPDLSGSVSIYNGETFSPTPLHIMSECHSGNCYALAVDPKNRFFVTGGTDSLIGIWDMSDFSLIKTISNNDARVIAVSINFDGSLIASICEDDINKKYLIEVYDFNYDDPSSSSGG